MTCLCKSCQELRSSRGIPPPAKAFKPFTPQVRLSLYRRVMNEAVRANEHPFKTCRRIGISINQFNQGRIEAAQANAIVELPQQTEEAHQMQEHDHQDGSVEVAAEVPAPVPVVEKTSRMSDEARERARQRMKEMRASGKWSSGPRRPREVVLAEKRAKAMKHVEKLRKLGFTVYLPGEEPELSEEYLDREPDSDGADDGENGDQSAEHDDAVDDGSSHASDSITVAVLRGAVGDVAEALERILKSL